MKIHLNQFLTSISLALDLAAGDVLKDIHLNHGRRVAYISLRLAEYLSLSEEEKLDLYYGALLHDIGITKAFFEYHSQEELIREHCLYGAWSLKTTHLFSEKVHEMVLHHHENWDGSGPFGIGKEELEVLSQIIRIADEVELHFLKDKSNVHQRDSIKQHIYHFSNHYFSPTISSTMLHLFNEERFWWDLSFPNQDIILSNTVPNKRMVLTMEQIKELVLILATIIDGKSSFTGSHTGGIVQKALIIASSNDSPLEDLFTLELGAYLHDLGKLAIPKRILEKPSSLNQEEYTIIKSHAYYSKLLMKRIQGMEEIASIAGNHHEKLDGTGYPEGLKGKDLTYHQRLLGVLDIYQALIEDRPYRPGMTHTKALKILRMMAKDGKIDREITEEVDRTFR